MRRMILAYPGKARVWTARKITLDTLESREEDRNTRHGMGEQGE